jgi:hypothetical protein
MDLLPALYPGAFRHLAAYTAARADLVAIFATGIPGALIGSAFGFGTYQGGAVIAEMLRLSLGIAPTGSGGAGTSNLGLLGGDLAGFPNGRRVTDDVVSIELKAVAGATDRDFVAGVYPELLAGTYTVWSLDKVAMGTVVIEGGRVTEFDAGDCRAPTS